MSTLSSLLFGGWTKRAAPAAHSELGIMPNEAQYYWIPDDDEVWVLASTSGAEVIKGGICNFTIEGKSNRVNKALNNCIKTNYYDMKDCDVEDLVSLPEVNEASILCSVKTRFMNQKIYTSMGLVLMVMNPFKQIDGIYSEQMKEYYRDPYIDEIPSHVYLVPSRAYNAVKFLGKNQSILISGESGAGKTEATKQCLSFITHIAASSSNSYDIANKIIAASPILEAFGNSKTIRNSNSSRFGKWMVLKFDDKNNLCASNITPYLLEKSRVTRSSSNERNYHIFYQVLKGCDKNRLDFLNLTPNVQEYKLLSSGILTDEMDSSDASLFNETIYAFRSMGFLDEEIWFLLSLVSTVLHLGNIDVVGSADGESSTISENDPNVVYVATCLGIHKDLFCNALTTSIMQTGKVRRSVTIRKLNVAKACETRNSLARALYENLFLHIINRINTSSTDGSTLSKTTSSDKFIGLLDIFGFEIFQSNSFEQLCINYCNELLQNHFNYVIFARENQMYVEEGIVCETIAYCDNSDVINDIQVSFQLLDEEAKYPKCTSKTWYEKLRKTVKEKKFQKITLPKVNNDLFVVKHYAGEVTYFSENFLEKNIEVLSNDIAIVMQQSTVGFVQALFEQNQSSGSTDGPGKMMTKSISYNFNSQLQSLIKILHDTESHFIRCIKSNMGCKPMLFESPLVSTQLLYSGVFEVVKIQQSGLPMRVKKELFLKNYRCLLPVSDRKNITSCDQLLNALKVSYPLNLSQCGKTLVFFKSNEYNVVERERKMVTTSSGFIIAYWVKAAIINDLFQFILKSNVKIDELIQDKKLAETKSCLEKIRVKVGSYKIIAKTAMFDVLLMSATEKVASLEKKLEYLQQIESLYNSQDPNVIPTIRNMLATAGVFRLENDDIVIKASKMVNSYDTASKLSALSSFDESSVLTISMDDLDSGIAALNQYPNLFLNVSGTLAIANKLKDVYRTEIDEYVPKMINSLEKEKLFINENGGIKLAGPPENLLNILTSITVTSLRCKDCIDLYKECKEYSDFRELVLSYTDDKAGNILSKLMVVSVHHPQILAQLEMCVKWIQLQVSKLQLRQSLQVGMIPPTGLGNESTPTVDQILTNILQVEKFSSIASIQEIQSLVTAARTVCSIRQAYNSGDFAKLSTIVRDALLQPIDLLTSELNNCRWQLKYREHIKCLKNYLSSSFFEKIFNLCYDQWGDYSAAVKHLKGEITNEMDEFTSVNSNTHVLRHQMAFKFLVDLREKIIEKDITNANLIVGKLESSNDLFQLQGESFYAALCGELDFCHRLIKSYEYSNKFINILMDKDSDEKQIEKLKALLKQCESANNFICVQLSVDIKWHRLILMGKEALSQKHILRMSKSFWEKILDSIKQCPTHTPSVGVVTDVYNSTIDLLNRQYAVGSLLDIVQARAIFGEVGNTICSLSIDLQFKKLAELDIVLKSLYKTIPGEVLELRKFVDRIIKIRKEIVDKGLLSESIISARFYFDKDYSWIGAAFIEELELCKKEFLFRVAFDELKTCVKNFHVTFSDGVSLVREKLDVPNLSKKLNTLINCKCANVESTELILLTQDIIKLASMLSTDLSKLHTHLPSVKSLQEKLVLCDVIGPNLTNLSNHLYFVALYYQLYELVKRHCSVLDTERYNLGKHITKIQVSNSKPPVEILPWMNIATLMSNLSNCLKTNDFYALFGILQHLCESSCRLTTDLSPYHDTSFVDLLNLYASNVVKTLQAQFDTTVGLLEECSDIKFTTLGDHFLFPQYMTVVTNSTVSSAKEYGIPSQRIDDFITVAKRVADRDIYENNAIFSNFPSIVSSSSKINSMLSLEVEGGTPIILSKDDHAQNLCVSESTLAQHHRFLESFKDTELSSVSLIDLLRAYYELSDTLLLLQSRETIDRDKCNYLMAQCKSLIQLLKEWEISANIYAMLCNQIFLVERFLYFQLYSEPFNQSSMECISRHCYDLRVFDILLSNYMVVNRKYVSEDNTFRQCLVLLRRLSKAIFSFSELGDTYSPTIDVSSWLNVPQKCLFASIALHPFISRVKSYDSLLAPFIVNENESISRILTFSSYFNKNNTIGDVEKYLVAKYTPVWLQEIVRLLLKNESSINGGMLLSFYTNHLTCCFDEFKMSVMVRRLNKSISFCNIQVTNDLIHLKDYITEYKSFLQEMIRLCPLDDESQSFVYLDSYLKLMECCHQYNVFEFDYRTSGWCLNPAEVHSSASNTLSKKLYSVVSDGNDYSHKMIVKIISLCENAMITFSQENDSIGPYLEEIMNLINEYRCQDEILSTTGATMLQALCVLSSFYNADINYCVVIEDLIHSFEDTLDIFKNLSDCQQQWLSIIHSLNQLLIRQRTKLCVDSVIRNRVFAATMPELADGQSYLSLMQWITDSDIISTSFFPEVAVKFFQESSFSATLVSEDYDIGLSNTKWLARQAALKKLHACNIFAEQLTNSISKIDFLDQFNGDLKFIDLAHSVDNLVQLAAMPSEVFSCFNRCSWQLLLKDIIKISSTAWDSSIGVHSVNQLLYSLHSTQIHMGYLLRCLSTLEVFKYCLRQITSDLVSSSRSYCNFKLLSSTNDLKYVSIKIMTLFQTLSNDYEKMVDDISTGQYLAALNQAQNLKLVLAEINAQNIPSMILSKVGVGEYMSRFKSSLDENSNLCEEKLLEAEGQLYMNMNNLLQINSRVSSNAQVVDISMYAERYDYSTDSVVISSDAITKMLEVINEEYFLAKWSTKIVDLLRRVNIIHQLRTLVEQSDMRGNIDQNAYNLMKSTISNWFKNNNPYENVGSDEAILINNYISNKYFLQNSVVRKDLDHSNDNINALADYIISCFLPQSFCRSTQLTETIFLHEMALNLAIIKHHQCLSAFSLICENQFVDRYLMQFNHVATAASMTQVAISFGVLNQIIRNYFADSAANLSCENFIIHPTEKTLEAIDTILYSQQDEKSMMESVIKLVESNIIQRNVIDSVSRDIAIDDRIYFDMSTGGKLCESYKDGMKNKLSREALSKYYGTLYCFDNFVHFSEQFLSSLQGNASFIDYIYSSANIIIDSATKISNNTLSHENDNISRNASWRKILINASSLTRQTYADSKIMEYIVNSGQNLTDIWVAEYMNLLFHSHASLGLQIHAQSIGTALKLKINSEQIVKDINTESSQQYRNRSEISSYFIQSYRTLRLLIFSLTANIAIMEKIDNVNHHEYSDILLAANWILRIRMAVVQEEWDYLSSVFFSYREGEIPYVVKYASKGASHLIKLMEHIMSHNKAICAIENILNSNSTFKSDNTYFFWVDLAALEKAITVAITSKLMTSELNNLVQVSYFIVLLLKTISRGHWYDEFIGTSISSGFGVVSNELSINANAISQMKTFSVANLLKQKPVLQWDRTIQNEVFRVEMECENKQVEFYLLRALLNGRNYLYITSDFAGQIDTRELQIAINEVSCLNMSTRNSCLYDSAVLIYNLRHSLKSSNIPYLYHWLSQCTQDTPIAPEAELEINLLRRIVDSNDFFHESTMAALQADCIGGSYMKLDKSRVSVKKLLTCLKTAITAPIITFEDRMLLYSANAVKSVRLNVLSNNYSALMRDIGKLDFMMIHDSSLHEILLVKHSIDFYCIIESIDFQLHHHSINDITNMIRDTNAISVSKLSSILSSISDRCTGNIEMYMKGAQQICDLRSAMKAGRWDVTNVMKCFLQKVSDMKASTDMESKQQTFLHQPITIRYTNFGEDIFGLNEADNLKQLSDVHLSHQKNHLLPQGQFHDKKIRSIQQTVDNDHYNDMDGKVLFIASAFSSDVLHDQSVPKLLLSQPQMISQIETEFKAIRNELYDKVSRKLLILALNVSTDKLGTEKEADVKVTLDDAIFITNQLGVKSWDCRRLLHTCTIIRDIRNCIGKSIDPPRIMQLLEKVGKLRELELFDPIAADEIDHAFSIMCKHQLAIELKNTLNSGNKCVNYDSLSLILKNSNFLSKNDDIISDMLSLGKHIIALSTSRSVGILSRVQQLCATNRRYIQNIKDRRLSNVSTHSSIDQTINQTLDLLLGQADYEIECTDAMISTMQVTTTSDDKVDIVINNVVEHNTKSQQLHDDVIFIINSIGEATENSDQQHASVHASGKFYQLLKKNSIVKPNEILGNGSIESYTRLMIITLLCAVTYVPSYSSKVEKDKGEMNSDPVVNISTNSLKLAATFLKLIHQPPESLRKGNAMMNSSLLCRFGQCFTTIYNENISNNNGKVRFLSDKLSVLTSHHPALTFMRSKLK